MNTPTFTCDRCGKGTRLRLNVAYHMICKPCFEAVCRDIDQFAGEGGSSPDSEGERGSDSEASTPHPPSPVPDSYLTAMRKDLGTPAESSDAGDGRPHVGDDTGDDPTGDAAPESFRTGGDTQPAAPSLVERLRDAYRIKHHVLVHEAADRIEKLERWKSEGMIVLGEWDRVYEALGKPGKLGESKALAALARVKKLEADRGTRPVDLASDDRLIPLPGGRVAVAAQDLRVGDVVAFEEVTRIVRHGQLVEVQTDGDTSVFWDGTLVLLDKAAES